MKLRSPDDNSNKRLFEIARVSIISFIMIFSLVAPFVTAGAAATAGTTHTGDNTISSDVTASTNVTTQEENGDDEDEEDGGPVHDLFATNIEGISIDDSIPETGEDPEGGFLSDGRVGDTSRPLHIPHTEASDGELPCLWIPPNADDNIRIESVLTADDTVWGWLTGSGDNLYCYEAIIKENAERCAERDDSTCFDDISNTVDDLVSDSGVTRCREGGVIESGLANSEAEAEQVCREAAFDMMEEIEREAHEGRFFGFFLSNPIGWMNFQAELFLIDIGVMMDENREFIFGVPAPGEPDDPQSWMDPREAGEGSFGSEWRGAQGIYWGLAAVTLNVLLLQIPYLMSIRTTKPARYKRQVKWSAISLVAVVLGPLILPMWFHSTNEIALNMAPSTELIITDVARNFSIAGLVGIVTVVLLFFFGWQALMALLAIAMLYFGTFFIYAIWPGIFLLILLGPWFSIGGKVFLTTYIAIPILKIVQAFVYRVADDMALTGGDGFTAAIAAVIVLWVVFIKFPKATVDKVVPNVVSQHSSIGNQYRATQMNRKMRGAAKMPFAAARIGGTAAHKGGKVAKDSNLFSRNGGNEDESKGTSSDSSDSNSQSSQPALRSRRLSDSGGQGSQPVLPSPSDNPTGDGGKNSGKPESDGNENGTSEGDKTRQERGSEAESGNQPDWILESSTSDHDAIEVDAEVNDTTDGYSDGGRY